MRFIFGKTFGEGKFGLSLAQLFNLSLAHNASISSLVSSYLVPHSWNFKFFRNPNYKECSGLSSLLSLLDGVSLRQSVPSKRMWLANSYSLFLKIIL